MKYAVILGDGMADLPEACPGGRTPLSWPAPRSLTGSAAAERRALEDRAGGMAPGSDTANLSILGYEGKRYYRGRASLEALALGICLGVHDLAFRCDLTGLSGDGPAFEEMQMGGPGPWREKKKRLTYP